jgi:hypothetical protein
MGGSMIVHICVHLTDNGSLVTWHNPVEKAKVTRGWPRAVFHYDNIQYVSRPLGWEYGNRKVLYNTFSIWPRLDSGRLP